MRSNEAIATFLGDMVVLDELVEVAEGKLPTPQRFLAHRGAGLRDLVLDDHGALTIAALVAIQQWTNSYAEPIEILRAFRANFLAGVEPTGSDLQEVTEATKVVLDGLARRLRRLAKQS